MRKSLHINLRYHSSKVIIFVKRITKKPSPDPLEPEEFNYSASLYSVGVLRRGCIANQKPGLWGRIKRKHHREGEGTHFLSA